MKHLNRPDVLLALPESDSRIKRLRAAMQKSGRRPDALIEVLHLTEDTFGYIPHNVMRFISRELRVPPSRVYGVVTFYHFFTLKPKGDHNCLVCTGTACHVKGSKKILDRIEEEFHLLPGETTADQRLGLQTARCLGCCGLAPAVVLDNEIHAKAEPENMVRLIHEKTGR